MTELGMGAKKYVMTAARKAALRKAQEKAWRMRRAKGAAKKAMKSEQKTQEVTRQIGLGVRGRSGSGSMRARQIAQRRMWEGSNYWGPNY
jgi:hypothetical protein